MQGLMKDKEALEKMAGNARQMIASRYEQGYMRQYLYDCYEDILRPFA